MIPAAARVVVFIAPSGHPADALLRLAVPCVPDAEPLLLGAIRAAAPAGATELVVELGSEGPESELALLDYWMDLPIAERTRVWAVAGALAGALARFHDRPTVAFAAVADDGALGARPLNAQTRSLLMAAHADTWTLAADGVPPVDADTWRSRLASIVGSRWSVGSLDRPAEALKALACQWGLDAALLVAAMGMAAPVRAATPSARGSAGWLDAELGAVLGATGGAAGEAGERARADVTPAGAEPASGEVPRALRGRRGRLFLASDSHDSHRQILGERPLTPGELEVWAGGTAARVDWLSARGCRFVHLIGPAPQVVHADDLPGALSPSPTRPAGQLLDRLGARAPLLYPLEALLGARAASAPFSLTDSHWNDLGAFVAYEAVLDRLGDGGRVRRVERADVAFHETVYAGDLGSKLRPERASIFLRARLDAPRARLVEDNRVRNHGRRAVYECEAAPPATCVVFGDSWAYPMMLFLAESFRRTVFVHRVNVVDRRPVEQEQPDVVLVVLTERFCDAVPDDAGAVDFDQLVAKKIRKGDLVAPARPGERYEFLHSLALDRQLPDRAGVRLPASAAAGRRS